jgi:single-strand DNA-binding protein
VQNVNLAVITGNLTKDPELRYTAGETPVTEIRVGVNGRRKNSQTGTWEDKANFFDVVVFGGRAEAVAKHLAKGSRVAVEGRLDWQTWEAKDGSGRRQSVKIIANHVEFLGSPKGSEETEPESEEPVGDAVEPEMELAAVA